MSDPARLPELARQWDDLIDERCPGAVFRSSAWLLPWWRSFSRGKELCIYAAKDRTGLVGVLPAYHTRSPLGGQQLRLMGDGVVTSDYLGVIARSDQLAAAAEPIARAILTKERYVLLDGVIADDPLIDALRQSGRGNSVTPDECPYVPINALPDFDTWIDGRPALLRQRFRNCRRWLEKRPGFRIEIMSDEDEIAATLPTLWELHRARWAIEGGTKAVTSPEVDDFHRDSARALAQHGWARLYLLHAEGAPRGAQYGFERGGRFMAYQAGHDPDWRKRSIGTVLLCIALEDAFKRGLDDFDLLRGVERYKALYTSSCRRVVTIQAAAGPRARALRLADQARRLAVSAAGAVLSDDARKRLGGRR